MANGFSSLSDGAAEFEKQANAAASEIAAAAESALGEAQDFARAKLAVAQAAASEAFDEFSTFQGDMSETVQNLGDSLYDFSESLGGLGSKIGDVASNFNSSFARLNLAGLGDFGKGLLGGTAAKTVMSWANGNQIAPAGVAGQDWRIRISVSPNAPVLYEHPDNDYMEPLFQTLGVIFPITPNLQVTHTAKYNAQSLTHSNYDAHFYEGSSVASIMIAGEFPIQNIDEGRYLLAAIYFFRAATKMYFGKGNYAGTPPPMVFLNGYGGDYFPNVPCVVTQFMHTLPDTVDYIEIPAPKGSGRAATRLPTQSTLQVTVQPIYSRAAVQDFSLDDFANGSLINKGFM